MTKYAKYWQKMCFILKITNQKQQTTILTKILKLSKTNLKKQNT